MLNNRTFLLLVALITLCAKSWSQPGQAVKVVQSSQHKKVDIFIGGCLFTSFLYPDSLEKPVLYPLNADNGTAVTRGFPLNPQPGDPTDHPHHIGLWFNYENLNDLDFWNNSYAIPQVRKHLYGWIRNTHVLKISSGKTGLLIYESSWTNEQKDIILQETTRFTFSGSVGRRIINRTTTLKAIQKAIFTDVKDGLLGLRIAHQLQMPDSTRKPVRDSIPTGNYLSSTGATGNKVWGTRASWCKVFGKMGADSVSIAIIDHPANPNYPGFWHARGYGLFAINPLGEKVFTNGKSAKNLSLNKGESVTFKYQIIINNGKQTPAAYQLNRQAAQFATKP
ncbi:PmoA family protein [Mucilaginibacter sp. PAMB04274]|uniref:DUF6807 domain-containing protein n=1 Tax=Mucilaginibacter sp. PAMB04274 TaxID=3138568 RepID=UPI0031F5F8C6